MSKSKDEDDRPFIKSVEIRPAFMPGEAADLAAIGEAWDVSRPTVVWAIVSDWLQRLRDRELIDLPLGHKATDSLHKTGYFQKTRPIGGPRSVGENLHLARDVLNELEWRDHYCLLCGGNVDQGHGAGCRMADALSGARGKNYAEKQG